MPDIVTLGFEFNSGSANHSIQKLIEKFDALENKNTTLKTAFSDVFNTGFTDIIKAASGAMKEFNGSMKSAAHYAKRSESSVKNLQTHIADLATDKIKPIPDNVIAAPTQYAENMRLASSELKGMFSNDFIGRIKTSKQELDKFNIILQQTKKFAKEASEQIGKIPNLSKLNSETIKPLSPQVVTNLAEYARVVRSASEAMQALNKSAQGIKSVGVNDFGNTVQQTEVKTRSLMSTLKEKFSFDSFSKSLRQMTHESIRFGEELAHIVSLSQEFDTGKLRKEILNISSEFGDSTKLANATYYAYSSGVRGTEKQMASFTKSMGKLATLIRADVTPTVDAVTSAMNAYGLGVESATEFTDLFYGIVKQGKASGAQLASSIGQVIPTAANVNIELNEVGASLATLTKVIQTRNAITFLNNMISKLIKPTKESSLAARKYGIELGVTALKAKGFTAVLEEIREKTQGSSEAISRIFPDLRGTRAATHLLGLGWKDFNTQLDFFNNKAGIADEAMKTLSRDVNFQIGQIPNTLKKLRISFGEIVTDVLTLGGALTPVIAAFNNMGETTQKTITVITAIGAGIAVLKTSVIGFNALRAVEIKSNEVLAAQQTREIQNRTKLAAVTKTQAKATAANSVANLASRVDYAAKLNEKAVSASQYLDFSRREYEMAKATGQTAAATLAYNRYLKAKTAFLKANERAEAANIAILKLKEKQLVKNAALQKTGMFSNIASAFTSDKGFKGGFGSSFGRDGLKALAQWKHLGKATKSINLLQGAMSLFGKGLGTLASVALKIFSPLNVFIGSIAFAAVSLVDVINTKGATWQEKAYNSKIIGNLAKWLYSLFDDTIVMNERLKKYQQIADEGDVYLAGLMDWKENLIKEFSNESVVPKTTTFDSVQKTYEAAIKTLLDPKFQNDLSRLGKLQSEFQKAQSTLRKTPDSLKNDFEEAQKALEYVFGKDSDAYKRGLERISKAQASNYNQVLKEFAKKEDRKTSDTAIGKQLTLESYWDIRKEQLLAEQEAAKKQITDISPIIDAIKSKTDKGVAKGKEAAQAIRTLYKSYYDSLQSISATVEKVRFSMMSPDEQMKQTEKSFKENTAKFFAIYKNDPSVAKAAFDKAVSAHNAIIQDAKKKLEKYQSFQKTLRGDALDALLKATTSLPEQMRLLYAESRRLAQEAGKEKDLPAKYKLSKRSIEFEIKAIELRNRLAKSEYEANKRTVELIQSMDKFKTTAQDAIEANSVDAVKLQARAFTAMPKFTPATTAQNDLSSAQSSVRASYEKLAQLAESMRQQAAAREQQEKQRLDAQNAEMEKNLSSWEDVQKHWLKQMEVLDKKQEELAKALKERLGVMEENIKKTADNTAKVAVNTQRLTHPVAYPR
jgi:TP901 family phage tail tape measure protein